MTKLKYFNYNNYFSRLDFLVNDLIDKSFIKTKELIIAHTKFFELSQKISQGNFSLYHISLTSDSVAFFNICNSILAYQACYDYFLQIIYFGFGFNDDFTTSEEYRKQLKDGCRLVNCEKKEINGEVKRISIESQFSKDINSYRKSCAAFDAFFKQFQSYNGFKSDRDYGIASWANCIKHQGGFITEELFDNELNNQLSFFSNDSSQSFSTSELYAFKPTTDEVIKRLRKQNEKIVEISKWLFELFFPVRKIEAFQTRPLALDNQILF